MTKLSSNQTFDLLTAHCYRVIENMNHDDLMSYAIQMMIQSFDKNPGQGHLELDIDLNMLIQDIWIAEREDDDDTAEFIAGVLGNEIADEIIKTVHF